MSFETSNEIPKVIHRKNDIESAAELKKKTADLISRSKQQVEQSSRVNRYAAEVLADVKIKR